MNLVKSIALISLLLVQFLPIEAIKLNKEEDNKKEIGGRGFYIGGQEFLVVYQNDIPNIEKMLEKIKKIRKYMILKSEEDQGLFLLITGESPITTASQARIISLRMDKESLLIDEDTPEDFWKLFTVNEDLKSLIEVLSKSNLTFDKIKWKEATAKGQKSLKKSNMTLDGKKIQVKSSEFGITIQEGQATDESSVVISMQIGSEKYNLSIKATPQTFAALKKKIPTENKKIAEPR